MKTITDLASGDEVIVIAGICKEPLLWKVHRVTDTAITIVDLHGGEQFFTRADGRQCAGFHVARLEVPTDELRETVARNECLRRIQHAEWENLPLAELRDAADLADKSQEESQYGR